MSLRKVRDGKGRFRKFADDDWQTIRNVWNDAYETSVDTASVFTDPSFANRTPFHGVLGDAWDHGIALSSSRDEQQVFYGLDAVKTAFWDGDLAETRRLLGTDRIKSATWQVNAKSGYVDPEAAALHTRELADAYIEAVKKRVEWLTGGDDELLEMLATGRLSGHTFREGAGPANRKFMQALKRKVEAGSHPKELVGPEYIHRQPEALEQLNEVVNSLFDVLMTRPDNAFFRSPLYRQRYWERMAHFADRLDPDALANVRANIDKAGLPKQLRKAFDEAQGTGRLTLAEATDVAHIYGLDEVRSTLYDLSRRSQLAESANLISPFIEAWREVLGFWSRQLVSSPATLRKAQQGIEGARDSGMFYQNERGEEVFAYPGGRLLAKLVGAPEAITLEARASGLNLVSSSVLPGVGPVVQWPVSVNPGQVVEKLAHALTPLTMSLFGENGWDTLRQSTIPFGGPERPDQIAGDMLPSWLTQALTGLMPDKFDVRGYNNLVGQVMTANVANGIYTRDQLDENFQAAEDVAAKLYLVRGIANSVAPTNFRPKLALSDLNGELVELEAMGVAFRDMVEKYGGDQEQAVVEFLGTYGIDPLLVAQSKSRQTTPRSSFDKGGAAWEAANLHLRADYPSTFGLFAPLSGEPADFGAFLDAQRQGDIEELDAKQQHMLANNTLGYRQFMHARQQLIEQYGDTPEVQAHLREFRALLRDQLPGFDTYIPGVPDRPKLDVQLRELEAAIADDRFDTPAKQILAEYFEIRQMMLDDLAVKGVTLKATKTGAPHRELLFNFGAALSQQHPEFQPLWNRVLSREVA